MEGDTDRKWETPDDRKDAAFGMSIGVFMRSEEKAGAFDVRVEASGWF